MYCRIKDKKVEEINLPSDKKLLLFSPHPDDDVIGMGGFLSKLISENEVKIFYLTTGFKGVGRNISKEEKIKKRRNEAIKAANIIGLESESLKFLDLPFYEKGKVTFEDIKELNQEVVAGLGAEINCIDGIYVCNDFADPHKTHYKCFKIFQLWQRENKIKNKIFYYKSIWSSFLRREIDYAFLFDEKIMHCKIQAVKAHVSQLRPAYPGSKIKTPFWKRNINKDKEASSLIPEISFYKYAELFSKM